MYLAWLNQLDGRHWPEILHRYMQPHDEFDREHVPHAMTLYQSVLDLNAQVVLEIGTYKGKSTRIITEALKKTGGHLWSIDVGEYEPIAKDDPLRSFVTFIKSDFRDVKIDRNPDLIFSDASHIYEDTYDELEKFWPLLNEPGLYIVVDVDSHIQAKEAVTNWAERKNIGFIFDFRSQGAAYFIKPSYSERCRGVLGSYQPYKWIQG